jgi:hypothetical protein
LLTFNEFPLKITVIFESILYGINIPVFKCQIETFLLCVVYVNPCIGFAFQSYKYSVNINYLIELKSNITFMNYRFKSFPIFEHVEKGCLRSLEEKILRNDDFFSASNFKLNYKSRKLFIQSNTLKKILFKI